MERTNEKSAELTTKELIRRPVAWRRAPFPRICPRATPSPADRSGWSGRPEGRGTVRQPANATRPR